ncbi:hypothetical protein LOTGIDRAFT_153931 [Lottia gigantea]|uniref:Antistasin-like domain-containing protein n=1 Tax=Lottia gigantea TaxID=225164 RepID=V3ZJN3_LOTGI|nr:hypothetical protein LOTGIDRAFT_153931 [Lottia gigantea]ESO91488.1 hypothetical protein LOTGIDRAFT_153931 [Lottia gigantea]
MLNVNVILLLVVVAVYTSDGCGPPKCNNLCPNGYVYDQIGCRTCECNKGILFGIERCQNVYCPNKCPYDLYKKDEFGCGTCLCKQAKTETKVKPLIFFHLDGDKQNKGLKCKQLVGCDLFCVNGYASNRFGCVTCQCRTRESNNGLLNTIEPTIPLKHNKAVKCPRVQCHQYCSSGFMYDGRGCRTCQCNRGLVFGLERCKQVYCPNYCPHNLYVKDWNGCQTCRCQKSESKIQFKNYQNEHRVARGSEGSRGRCPRLAGCDLFCVNGYVKDLNGCTHCECKKRVRYTRQYQQRRQSYNAGIQITSASSPAYR